ncbi:MAG TPA: MBL fold metallo-hydrolase [Vicinamibacteria bacterium]|nr:MBL fold metallo-hydrolase [Vicinamibacteria bacterium]
MKARLAALLWLAALPALAQQQDFSKVEVKAEKLVDGIYVLTGAGGNIGLSVGRSGTFVIDDQYAPLTDRILAAIRAITPDPVRFVVNTHWHGDHTGGNENMGRAGALLVAHENVRRRMGAEQFNALFDRKTPPSPEGALPVVTFTDAITLHWNGDEIRVYHVPPAHTDTDSIVHFVKADVVHMGDVFFNGSYPFIDASSGGRVDGVIEAADRALAGSGAATRFIPGHGPAGTRADLQAYRDTLKTLRDRIAKLKAEGKSRDQAIAAKPTADHDAKWGTGFMKGDTFTGIVYDTLP